MIKDMCASLRTQHFQIDLQCCTHYMKLEIAWILANLTFASDDVCVQLMTDQPKGEPAKLSPIVEFIASSLQGDMEMFDMIIWVIGNLVYSEDCAKIMLQLDFLTKV